MVKFLHQLLNPHCEHCAAEKEAVKVCASCEVLKQELAIAHQNYRELLNRMTERAPEVEATLPPQITRPKFIPWKVKREILEKEDRVKAQAMSNAPKPKSTEELEKEIAG